jgi:hypothetical protein
VHLTPPVPDAYAAVARLQQERSETVPDGDPGAMITEFFESNTWLTAVMAGVFRRYQFLGAVPRSPAVQRATDDGRLLHAFDTAVERAIRGVPAHLVDEPALAPEPAAGRSGLDRILARLFAGRGAR